MPEKILGLDISSDSVSAVQVTGKLRSYQITACGHTLIEEAGGLEEALKKLIEEVGPDSDVCISSIPAEYVSYRNIRMPFRDKKKVSQTILFELETMVPFAVEDLVVDFTMLEGREQSEILAASVRRTYISEYLAHLQTNGIDPTVLDISGVPTVCWLLKQPGTPDRGLLLSIGGDRNTMVLYNKKRVALVRTFLFDGGTITRAVLNGTTGEHTDSKIAEQIELSLESFSTEVQNTLHAFEWQTGKAFHPERIFVTGTGAFYPDIERILNRLLDLPVERVDLTKDLKVNMEENIAQAWNPGLMDSAFALAVRETKKGLGFNFRKDEFEVKKQSFVYKKEFLKGAAFLMVVLFLLILNLGVDYYFLKKQHGALGQQITEIFRQAFPDVKRVVNPIQQMNVKINEIKKSASLIPGVSADGKVLDLLMDISERTPESVDVHVTRIAVDPDAVLVRGETDTFNTVDTIKKGLEPSPYFSAVTISSANLDRTGKRVRFEMKLKRAE